MKTRITKHLYLVLATLIVIMVTTCAFTDDDNKVVNKVVISFDSNYDPIPPAFARMGFWGGSTSINGLDIERVDGKFVFKTSISQGTQYVFNILTNNYTVCGEDANEWVASKRGIRAKEIKVNDKVQDNSYLFYNHDKSGANFIFVVDNKGEVIPGQGESFEINTEVPSEVWFDKEVIHSPSASIVNLYGNAWFSVIHDHRKTGTSQVEIESFKFGAKLSNGQNIILASDEYNNAWGGKLYIRYPYFECSSDPAFMFDMPAQLVNGKLVFKPSDNINRVWHGWCTGDWPRIPYNAVSLWVEADVKITGNALIQLGVDLRRSQYGSEGYREYGVSNWFFQSNNFRVISFNKP